MSSLEYKTEDVKARIARLDLSEKDRIALTLLCQIRDLLIYFAGSQAQSTDEDLPGS